MFKRTHTCGELSRADEGKEVVLIGWAQRFRDHGGKIFIDLRDREGLTQIVFDPSVLGDKFTEAESIRKEFLLSIRGLVRLRPEGTVNEKLKTGEIEVLVKDFEVISKSKVLPFEIDEEHFKGVGEEVRLKYRYLDLRRKEMLNVLKVRSRFFNFLRSFLISKGFIEVETPYLTKSTPEGARDLLVPSRKHKGTFYALPQSPQLFKQLLMVAGIEKYFQIARCFRDEDSRKDRQLEFTQLDIEVSFMSQDELFSLMEEMFSESFKEIFGIDVKIPFKRMSYREAIERYGTDRPDLRIDGMELKDISDIVEGSGFSVFASVVKSGGIVKGLNVKRGTDILSRKDIDRLIEFIQELDGKGLAWMKVTEKGLESSITKFFNEDELTKISERLEAEPGDLLLFVADGFERCNELLDSLRRYLAKKLGLIKEGYEFVWIVDFPMFHWNSEEGVIEAEHSPFTMCKEEFEDMIREIKDREDAYEKKDELLKVTSDCYDLVLNGIEISSGARRITDPELQAKVFEIIGLTKEEVNEKFGWFLEAYNYGAPPHRGLAPGLDRILMIILGKDSIREVIPFPKNKVGYCPLTESPSRVEEHQLKELGIEVISVKEDKVNVKFPENRV